MPVPALKGIAKRSGKSLSDVEGYWNRAKKAVKKQYGYKTGSDRYYKAVMGITKKMAGESIDDGRLDDMMLREQINDIIKMEAGSPYDADISKALGNIRATVLMPQKPKGLFDKPELQVSIYNPAHVQSAARLLARAGFKIKGVSAEGKIFMVPEKVPAMA